MTKVRFAPSPTGSLHIGNALGAVANRNFGGTMLLRIDDTDPARNVPGGEDAILDDLRSLAVEVIASFPDDQLAERVGVPTGVVPALRGAHDLNEARVLAGTILGTPSVSLPEERPTLERFRELREGANGGLDAAAATSIVRELKAVGNLRAVRRALTGRNSGPELWAIIVALSREETLRRVDGAL